MTFDLDICDLLLNFYLVIYFLVQTDGQTARRTTLYYAPSSQWSIMNIQNRLVHHLVSTKHNVALTNADGQTEGDA